MNAPRNGFNDLMDLLSSGYKIAEITPLPQHVSFSIVGFESIDNTNPFPYSVSFANCPELQSFVQSVQGPHENNDKRFLRRTLRKGFMLIDVVGFSILSLDFQVGLLSRFQELVRESILNNSVLGEAIEGFIPTGDGCYIVFSEQGIPLMIELYDSLMTRLGIYNSENISPTRLYFRTSINAGHVDYFYDLNHYWNYVGPGINNTERILSQIPKDQRNVLFVSEDISALSIYASRIWGPITTFKDKHGVEHRYRQLIH